MMLWAIIWTVCYVAIVTFYLLALREKSKTIGILDEHLALLEEQVAYWRNRAERYSR